MTQDESHNLPDEVSVPPELNTARVVKRRIFGKAAASETVGFPTQPQITKTEQRRLRGIEKEKARKLTIEDNKAKARARASLLHNPGLAGNLGDEAQGHGEDAVVDPLAPHPTHDLGEMVSAAVTYCNNCSHWLWHNKQSKLAKQCEPLLRGNATVLGLLQCDVVPVKGAKLPLHMRKRSWAPGQPKR